MIDYRIKDEKSYNGDIRSIKQSNSEWQLEFPEKEIELVLTYDECCVNSIKINAIRVPIIECSFFRGGGPAIQIYTQSKNLQKEQWESKKIVYFERSGLHMEPSNEVRIKLRDNTPYDLKMGLQLVKITRSRSDTPVKRVNNLSPVDEYQPSSGVKLLSATKSPHSVFKARIREPDKSHEFKVQPKQPSLKQAVLDKKFTSRMKAESSQSELEMAIRLSKQDEEERKRREKQHIKEQLSLIDEEQTIVIHDENSRISCEDRAAKPKVTKHRIEKRQIELLHNLTRQYRQLQKQAQREMGIAQSDQVSKLIASRKPFSGETIVTSGYEDPIKADLVKKAKELGFEYSPDVIDGCFLVAQYTKAPKVERSKEFRRITIVDIKYIQDCFSQKQRLPVDRYLKK